MEVLLGCMTTAEGNVEVSPTVEYVNGNAFYGCSGIETLNFNSNEIEFSPDSLSGCENLRTINSANTIDCITYTSYIDSGKKALLGASEKNVITYERKIGILFCNREASGSYTIPDFVRYISENAFANCTGLVVDIPGTVSLESIGDKAFWDCRDLTEVEMGENTNINDIGKYLFSGCNSLTEENVAEPLKPAKAEPEKPIENYEPDGPVVDPEPENPVEEPAVQPVIPETTVKIKNYRKDISVDYRSSLTFTAEVENGKAKDVVWLVNGKEYTKGETCTINEAKEKEYKVQCTVKKADGNTAYSETETVTVNTGFFAKIIAFFRGIFKKLPVYIDNAKK